MSRTKFDRLAARQGAVGVASCVQAVGFSLPGNSGDFMSTTPHPPSTEAASNTAERVTRGSRRSPNSLMAARVVRQTRRSGPPDHREPGVDDHPEQLALTFEPPKEPAPRPSRTEKPPANTAIQRFATLDQRMSTTDVLRVVGVNRSTIFRWVKRGLFPQRHASGGWLRSDVEHWLSEKMGSPR